MVGPRRRSFTFSIFSSMEVCIIQIISFFFFFVEFFTLNFLSIFVVQLWLWLQFDVLFSFSGEMSRSYNQRYEHLFSPTYSHTHLRQIVSRKSEFNRIVAFNSKGEILCVCRLCNISYLTCQVLLSLPHMHFWFSSGLRFIIRQVLLFFCFSTIYFYE